MIMRTKLSSLTDEVEDFRTQRIEQLAINKQPIAMYPGAKMVLHVIPSTAFGDVNLDLASLATGNDDLWPMATGGGGSRRFNFDGIAAITSTKGESDSYVQVFHNGAVEAVNVSFFHRQDSEVFIPVTGWEEELIKRVGNYISILRRLTTGLPLFVMVSLLGVKGYRLMTDDSYPRSEGYEIDRDNLLVPALRIESFESEIAKALLPVFNRIWNAAGLPRSINYDPAGNRKRK